MSNTEQAPEPSMEEILASIRRIISDDDKPAGAAPEAGQAVPEAEQAAPEQKSADAPQAEPDVVKEVEEAAENATAEQDPDIFDLTEIVPEEAGQVRDDVIVAEPELDPAPVADQPEAEPVTADILDDFESDLDFVDAVEAPAEDTVQIVDQAADEPVAAAGEPAVAEPVAEEPSSEALAPGGLLSGDADAATSSAFKVLAETLVARKGSSRTLEDLLEDLLRPMLKSWLDKNLPVLTERLVRDEIERVTRRGGL